MALAVLNSVHQSHCHDLPGLIVSTVLFCSNVPYHARGTVYTGAGPARSVGASTYGRNAYV